MDAKRRRLAIALHIAAVWLLRPAPAVGLELVAREQILPVGGLQLVHEELGCAPADVTGAVRCSGGPAADPLLLPEFRLDSWEILSGPDAHLEITFTITDLGAEKPNVAGVALFGPEESLSVAGPARMVLAGSISVTDANGDGAASIQPFPESLCACEVPVVTGGINVSPNALPIALPIVSSAFGTMETSSDLEVLLPGGAEIYDMRLFFAGNVSSGDSATVRLSLTARPIPEPTSAGLTATALALLSFLSRRPAHAGRRSRP